MPEENGVWSGLGLTRGQWRELAGAFYSLAHGHRGAFLALPTRLREHEAGSLCQGYLWTGDRELLERAGRLLTGTSEWYVYLGRSM